MYTCKIRNQKGEILNLTNSSSYEILKITGLNPPPALINFSNIPNFDGSTYNSARLNNRNIVLTIKIHSPVEQNRIRLYQFFQMKRLIRIYYQNDSRDVYIDGYIETFDFDLFTINETVQISVLCPNPYWKENDVTVVELSSIIPLFEFPFAIEEEGIEFSRLQDYFVTCTNNGDVEVGIIIEFTAIANQVLNPRLFNRTTQEFFAMDFDMKAGDVIRINTQRGEKSVILIRDGEQTNVINDMNQESTWLQLVPGMNELSYESDEGRSDLDVKVTLTKCYEGV